MEEDHEATWEGAGSSAWQVAVEHARRAAAEYAKAMLHLSFYDNWDFAPDDLVALGDHLRELGAACGQALFRETVDAMGPPPDRAPELERFDTAYTAYWAQVPAREQRPPPSHEATVAMRAAAAAVRKAKPRTAVELGRKVKVACIVGIHTIIKDDEPFPHGPCRYSYFWERLDPVEPWFLAQVVGYEYPIGELEYGRGRGDFIISSSSIGELLDSAGPSWRRAIAADVMRLNGRATKGRA